MVLKVSKVDVWVGGLRDRPGALAKKLRALADAGAELEFLIARRAPEKPSARRKNRIASRVTLPANTPPRGRGSR